MKFLKQIVLALIFLNITFTLNSQTHWESLIVNTDEFRYLTPETEPDVNWMQPSFNDEAWPLENGSFGYGDGDDDFILPEGTLSVYLRKKIDIPADISIMQLILDIDYDDAFVAYINGVEVARSDNLRPGTPALSGSVTADHEAGMYLSIAPDRFTLSPDVLTEGENTIAVHILNYNNTSSDLSSHVFLNAEINTSEILFHEIPYWFRAPANYTWSNLPIIKIYTFGASIPDEPKITADMKVINNNAVNYFNSTDYEYDGAIGIEIRGNTAQMFPKKSYSIETRLSNGENNNVSILGMPAENDWVLHGPYTDKSLMRNALAYHIGNGMKNGWHPRTQFIELMLNDEYAGIYLFTEKIKIDKNRVDIATLLPEDITGDELTGGYIMSIDRDQEGSWNSPFMGRTGSVDVPISYVDPKYDELQPQQRAYIKDFITEFEYALDGDNFKDPKEGYRNYINIISFIDYFIITELSKDLDGYRVSVYFHKDKDSNDGRLTMTPFWDYNLCFGNANFFEAGNTFGWASDGIGVGDWYEIPFWWDKFRTDKYFESMLKLRWNQLRETALNKDSLFNYIDSTGDMLAQAQRRNFEKFDILGSYIWPNNHYGGSYNDELVYLKNWLDNRLTWLDGEINSINAIDLQVPLVNTLSASNLTKSSATIGGDIIDDGGSYVRNRGVYMGLEPDPVQHGRNYVLGEGDGSFSIHIENLYPNMTYYTVAYAENDLGMSYGDEIAYTTLGDTVVDVSVNMLTTIYPNVYPNPFTDELNIEFSIPTDCQVKISISNILGKVIYLEDIYCNAGTQSFRVGNEVFNSGDGLYMYKIYLDDIPVKTGKVIKK